jgi:hypothetical protein
MRTGWHFAHFAVGNNDSLYCSYLEMVARLRNEPIESPWRLRANDVEAIAAFVKLAPSEVLDRLGGFLGADRGQRTAMIDQLRSGQSTIPVGNSSGIW